jgi:hypothetical protein
VWWKVPLGGFRGKNESDQENLRTQIKALSAIKKEYYD